MCTQADPGQALGLDVGCLVAAAGCVAYAKNSSTRKSIWANRVTRFDCGALGGACRAAFLFSLWVCCCRWIGFCCVVGCGCREFRPAAESLLLARKSNQKALGIPAAKLTARQRRSVQTACRKSVWKRYLRHFALLVTADLATSRDRGAWVCVRVLGLSGGSVS